MRYIVSLRPFGRALKYSLFNTRYSFDGYIAWEEKDCYSSLLTMERKVIVDRYFQELTIES